MSQELQQALTEIKTGVSAIQSNYLQLRNELDGYIAKGASFAGGSQRDELGDVLRGSDDMQKLMRGERKNAIIVLPSMAPRLKQLAIESKATLTEAGVGSQTTGVMPIERIPGIVGGAQRRNFMRDVLRVIPTVNSAVDFVSETSATPTASPVSEGSVQNEATMTFTSAVAPVRTLAVWIPASKQILDDLAGLRQFIETRLTYAVLKQEDLQILTGSGTGQDLDGLTHQATAFDTTLRGSSFQRLDIIRRALQQVETADESPTGFIVLNPADFAAIELTKTSTGEYIAGDPRSMMAPTLWGRPVVVSTAMSSGAFLIGSSESADIRMRQDVTVEISTEHSDYWTRGLIGIRAEERLALPVYRPGSLIYGTLVTSPA